LVRRILDICALLVLTPVAVLGVTILLLRAPSVQGWLGERVAAAVGPEVRVEFIKLSLARGFGIRLLGIEVRNLENPDQDLVLSAESARLIFDPDLLLDGEFEIQSVFVEHPVLMVEASEHSSFKIADVLIDIFSRDAELAEKASDVGPDPESNGFEVSVDYRDTRIVFVDSSGSSGDDPVVLKLERIRGALDYNKEDGRFDLTLVSRPERSGGIELLGHYGEGEHPGRFHITLTVEHFVPDELLENTRLNADYLGGRFEVSGDLAAEGAVGDTLKGQGKFRLFGGTIGESGAGNLVWKALLSIVPRNEKKDGEASTPSSATGPAKIEYFKTSLSIAEGSVEVESLNFVTDDYQVIGQGTIALDTTLDLQLEASLTPEGLKKTLAFGRIPVPTGPLKMLPPTPLAVSGTVAEPQVRPIIAELPLANAGYLVDKFVGAGGGVVQGVMGVVEKVGAGVKRVIPGGSPPPE
jgi:hypothetical protein